MKTTTERGMRFGEALLGDRVSHALPKVLFHVSGLAAKDETLLKSFVRLIAHRTNHHWEAADAEAEVWVVPASAVPDGPLGRHYLHVGSGERPRQHQLHLPFHADELEQCLNKLGEAVLAGRQRPRTGPLPLPERMRLVRWPPVHMVRSPERVRIATAMVGRFVTRDEVQLHARCPAPTCESFLQELMHEGLLAEEHTVPAELAPPTTPPRADRGLLAHIRNRLSRIAKGGHD